MKSNQFTTTILTADDNHFLTDADNNVDIKKRIIAQTIALGKFDSADNYIEIDKELADEYRKQQREALDAEYEAARAEINADINQQND